MSSMNHLILSATFHIRQPLSICGRLFLPFPRLWDGGKGGRGWQTLYTVRGGRRSPNKGVYQLYNLFDGRPMEAKGVRTAAGLVSFRRLCATAKKCLDGTQREILLYNEYLSLKTWDAINRAHSRTIPPV
jgi:hypothetical protein